METFTAAGDFVGDRIITVPETSLDPAEVTCRVPGGVMRIRAGKKAIMVRLRHYNYHRTLQGKKNFIECLNTLHDKKNPCTDDFSPHHFCPQNF